MRFRFLVHMKGPVAIPEGEDDTPTGQVTGQVEQWTTKVFTARLPVPLKSSKTQTLVQIRHREAFQRNCLDHLLDDVFIEDTLPDKPKAVSTNTTSLQKTAPL